MKNKNILIAIFGILLLNSIFAIDSVGGFPPIIEGDKTPPVITLLGPASIRLSQGDVYVDEGATAFDNVDGNITEDIVVVNPVNTSIAGTYTITYNVTDRAGNNATEVTRTVQVFSGVEPPTSPPDETPPVITLLGDASIRLAQGEVYVDAGATAFDNVDGNITGRIVVGYPVNTSIAGTYTITYNVTDSSGNEATEVRRTVNVTAPAPTGGGGGTRIYPAPVAPAPVPEETPAEETPPVETPVPEGNTNTGGETLTPQEEIPAEEATPVAPAPVPEETPTPSGLTGFAGFANSPGGVITIIGGALVVIGAIGYFFFLKPR